MADYEVIYSLAKRVPSMLDGCSIETNYGSIRLDSHESGGVAVSVRIALLNRLESSDYHAYSFTKESLSLLVDGLQEGELKTLRAIINGKLGKRKITPEQQAKMQAARQKDR